MKSNANILLAIALGLCALAPAGCVNRVSGYPPAGTSVEKITTGNGTEYVVTVNSLIFDNHIRVTERSARRRGEEPGAGEPDRRLLNAQVRGINVKSVPLVCEYRFIWLDADGIRLHTGVDAWKKLTLDPGGTAFMDAIASTPEAVDFFMEMKFAN